MTAESYAAAVDLVARSAAAYISGVPEDPADDGFFGPGSVTWRVSTDPGTPIAGLRSLMMQALHPLAMAGVDQHSDWRQDPVGRLAATPADLVPATAGELERYISSVRPELRCTPAARESMAYLLDPPGMDSDVAEIWQDVRDGAVAALPGWARELYGYEASPLTPERQTEIRQALGST